MGTEIPGGSEREDVELIGDQLTPDLLMSSSDGEKGGTILEGNGQLIRLPHLEKRTWLVPVEDILPNPKQPRTYFDEAKMAELEGSIKEHGLQQAINVVPYYDLEKDGIQLFIVDGERRFRTINKLGHREILATVTWLKSEKEIFETSLIINEARQDHNPIERARAYERLVDLYMEEDSIGKTESVIRIAGKLGVSTTTIHNSLRLLKLPIQIQEMVINGTLPTYGALQISSAKKKFGGKLNDARLAALLLAKPNKDFTSGEDGESGDEEGVETVKGDNGETQKLKKKLRITKKEVSEAIQQALITGGVSEAEAVQLEVSSRIIHFITALGQVKRSGNKILGSEIPRDIVIDLMRARGGGSCPPEVVVERIQEAIDTLRQVYGEIIKKAILPASLVISEGSPRFADHIKGVGVGTFRDNLGYNIALALAEASDNDGSLVTASAISEKLAKLGIYSSSTDIANRIRVLGLQLRSVKLIIDTHVIRRREVSKDKKMEKVSGYRLAWI